MKPNVFRMNGRLKWSIAGVVLEGLLTGTNFLALFRVLELIFDGTANFRDILNTTAVLAGIFVLRLILYTVSYTGSQTGGSDVSRRVRVAIGDKLKLSPWDSSLRTAPASTSTPQPARWLTLSRFSPTRWRIS